VDWQICFPAAAPQGKNRTIGYHSGQHTTLGAMDQ
jgi:hypothetical protein